MIRVVRGKFVPTENGNDFKEDPAGQSEVLSNIGTTEVDKNDEYFRKIAEYQIWLKNNYVLSKHIAKRGRPFGSTVQIKSKV